MRKRFGKVFGTVSSRLGLSEQLALLLLLWGSAQLERWQHVSGKTEALVNWLCCSWDVCARVKGVQLLFPCLLPLNSC